MRGEEQPDSRAHDQPAAAGPAGAAAPPFLIILRAVCGRLLPGRHMVGREEGPLAVDSGAEHFFALCFGG